MKPGIYHGMSMRDYQAIDALGSTQLKWLETSPRYYQYMRQMKRADTPSTELGTAVHAAVLEPETFDSRYCPEPQVGGARPRATNAYKGAVADLEERGLHVLTPATMDAVRAMASSVRDHVQAARALKRCPEREVSLLWERDGRLCRSRTDALGPASGCVADLKTTRTLRDFSPFELTKFGYFRQAAWYVDGLTRHGFEVKAFLFVVVESSPPYDVGVFALDESALHYGAVQCEHFLEQLADCERTNVWPGQFPEIVPGTITDRLAEQMANDLEVA